MTAGVRAPAPAAPPALVTLDVWRVARRHVPAALAAAGLDRPALARTPGLSFAKVLGTSGGRTFDVRDADLGRWALLACWDDVASARAFAARGAVARRWARRADEAWHADLAPLSARGRWTRRRPFGDGPPRRATPGAPVAVLTRARLRPRRALTFWRAVPPVAAEIGDADGLLAALGVGEAPVGLQGTVSVWRDERAVVAAARGPAHARAVADTARLGWYAEELFARFEVLDACGVLDGVDPLATAAAA